MRRFCLLLAAVVLAAVPFACAEDFSGGGGLPGDIPRGGDDGASDSGGDRGDTREADTAPPKDVVTVDTNEAGD